ncbi:hypothetical protein [Candidatus Mycoplasma haematominutum]|nr:hypothetical protein [Candidatus Mycoplasma haematominutum]
MTTSSLLVGGGLSAGLVQFEVGNSALIYTKLSSWVEKFYSLVSSAASNSSSTTSASGDWTLQLSSSLKSGWGLVSETILREGGNVGNLLVQAYSAVIDNFSSLPEIIKEMYSTVNPYLKSWESVKSKSGEVWGKKQELGKLFLKLFEHRNFIAELSKTLKILSSSSSQTGTFSEVVDSLSTILEKSSTQLEKIFKELVKSEVKSKLILKIAGNGMTGLKKVVKDWDRLYSPLFNA